MGTHRYFCALIIIVEAQSINSPMSGYKQFNMSIKVMLCELKKQRLSMKSLIRIIQIFVL